MNSDLKQRWETAFAALWKGAQDANPNDPHGGNATLTRGNAIARVANAFDLVRANTWAEGRAAFLRGRMSPGEPEYQEQRYTIKFLKAALAVAQERWDDIPPHEAPIVARYLQDVPWVNPPASVIHPQPAPEIDVLPGNRLSLDVAFLWVQPPRRGSMGRGFARATTRIAIDGMTSAEAPIECVLARPGAEGMPLRKVGDRWLRPVLAPGEWRTVRVGEFARAAREGWSWTDNPAMPRRRPRWLTDGFLPPLSADEVAEAIEPVGKAEVAAREAAEAEVQARCQGLFAIDGEVWIEISEPVLMVVTGRDGRPFVSWNAGGLVVYEPQETFAMRRRAPTMDTAYGKRVALPLSASRVIEGWVDGIAGRETRRGRSPSVLWSSGKESSEGARAGLALLLSFVAGRAKLSMANDIQSRIAGEELSRVAEAALSALEAGEADDIEKASEDLVAAMSGGARNLWLPGVRSMAKAVAMEMRNAVAAKVSVEDGEAISTAFGIS